MEVIDFVQRSLFVEFLQLQLNLNEVVRLAVSIQLVSFGGVRKRGQFSPSLSQPLPDFLVDSQLRTKVTSLNPFAHRTGPLT